MNSHLKYDSNNKYYKGINTFKEVYIHLLKEREDEVDNYLEDNAKTFINSLPKVE